MQKLNCASRAAAYCAHYFICVKLTQYTGVVLKLECNSVSLYSVVKHSLFNPLTLPILRLLSSKAKGFKEVVFKSHLNHAMLVFMCQGFGLFFLHRFVLAKLATTSIRTAYGLLGCSDNFDRHSHN